ncbi:MAG: hypothetical protein AB7V61_14070 [Methylocystis sp.]
MQGPICEVDFPQFDSVAALIGKLNLRIMQDCALEDFVDARDANTAAVLHWAPCVIGADEFGGVCTGVEICISFRARTCDVDRFEAIEETRTRFADAALDFPAFCVEFRDLV